MLRMREDEMVRQHASKLMDVVNKIRLLRENFPDSRVVEQILISLPARFESKISVLEELNDTDTITAAELINKLESQEQRANIRETNCTEGVLFIKAKARIDNKGKQTGEKSSIEKQLGNQNHGKQSKFPPCKICSLTNHLENDCWYKDKKAIQCHFCKKLGHKERNCRLKQKQSQPKREIQQVNITEATGEASANLYMASNEVIDEDDTKWIIPHVQERVHVYLLKQSSES